MFDSKLQMECESSGFTTIDKILNSFLKNQIQNQKINPESTPVFFAESNEQKNGFSLKNTIISKIEIQTKRKSDSMGHKNFRELYLTSIKRDDYSLSYDSSTLFNIDEFAECSSNNSENKKSTEKNEILKQKIKRVLIIRPNKITSSNDGFDHEILDEKLSQTYLHLKQKRNKKKKRVSFSGKATLFSYSYAKKSENEEYNLLAQSILKRLDALLDEESRERNIQAEIAHIIPCESVPKNDQKIVEEILLDEKLENQLRDSPLMLDKNIALGNFMILDEDSNDEPIIEDKIFARDLNENKLDEIDHRIDHNQEIRTTKIENINNQITDVTKNDQNINVKMETTSREEKEEEKIFTNQPMRLFVIERLGNLVEVDNKINGPRKTPQEEKINTAFDKIEKLLRQNGKLNRQKSRLSNAFSTYINNII
jgi:hypothetical protein